MLPRKAKDSMGAALTQAGEARKLSLSLKGVDYGGELNQKLMVSSQKLERIYELFSEALGKPTQDETKLKKYIELTEIQTKWFEKAKVGHRYKNDDKIVN